MNRIHRKVEYALIALRHMWHKQPGQLTTVKEVCRTYGCPFDATSRVLQVMVQQGLLKSEQGAQGGYLILRDLSKVSLYELIEMVVGPIHIVKCLDASKEPCEMYETCNVIAPLAHLNDQIVQFYKGVNIGDLLSIQEKKCLGSDQQVSMRVN
ncbi:MAG: Rrf2 family transcriptional regulator [Bdellovibrionales bacterium]|nr:Rrf2 family transcriptional regulator [Bdellovibrionales bacterium]